MKACVLQAPAKVESNPLQYEDVPAPEPGEGELLVRVATAEQQRELARTAGDSAVAAAQAAR